MELFLGYLNNWYQDKKTSLQAGFLFWSMGVYNANNPFVLVTPSADSFRCAFSASLN